MWKTRLFLAVVGGLAAAGAGAVECSDQQFEGLAYAVCEVDTTRADLRLFLQEPESGMPLGSFGAVDRLLKSEGKTLGFAMNAGMYHSDRSPVGLYVEDGKQVAGLVTSDGPGNFGLLPNGVFCIREGRADVIEALRFARTRPACRHASQSGPMLVIDGALHPRFLTDSDSRYIRNGVGTSADGSRAWFVISERRVNFHTFGRFFRDHLAVPQALYFDGKISRLYAPALDRFDIGFPMGPMVGVAIDADASVD
ncbi:phosphodiester glycosidase family protein [uncultured Roseovarius sp.]|uniref:phosphodiester glycosidase family protein n=1 Tax=uncultured Roseovarius sp. TaxID=293344 RepID=UPI00261BC65D|nr:phosphodiester glycosidase family protein [uncultured Roseovarius sp.]